MADVTSLVTEVEKVVSDYSAKAPVATLISDMEAVGTTAVAVMNDCGLSGYFTVSMNPAQCVSDVEAMVTEVQQAVSDL